jgi:SAM-dependent methyltransferase
VICPACASPDISVFFEERAIPLNSCLLLDERNDAMGFPTGDLVLGYCGACGFVTNTRFDQGSSEYSQRYEETQIFSATFEKFARDLASRWVDRYDLAGKTVLEIGCGKGEFLVMMVEAGAGRGIGIDPGVRPERIESDVADRLTWIRDFYSEDYAHLSADAVVCRHTLEHIPDVADFMTRIRSAIGDRPETIVLFELPDVARVLEDTAFWDVYYEHCSYFSLGSLARLFRHTGFEVLDLELDYDDQYLLIEARPSTVPAAGSPLDIEDDLDRLRAGVADFADTYATLRRGWRKRLAEVTAVGGTSVIWGGGSKGVSFVTHLDVADHIDLAVDINPYKHGKYLAGSGIPVVAPEALVERPPALVVVMNSIYEPEVRAELRRLELDPEVISL